MAEFRRRPSTTSDAGVPAPSDEHSLSARANRPTLLKDDCAVERTAQFNRERELGRSSTFLDQRLAS